MKEEKETEAPEAVATEAPKHTKKLADSDATITWMAEEYIPADKGPWWFVFFSLIVIGLVSIDFFFIKSWTFSILVVVMATTVIVLAKRPPRQITYALSSNQGLSVGEKNYQLEEFKSFGVIQEGGELSIMLIPVKRFAPGVSVYFPEEAGEKIVDILGQNLPMEQLKLDFIDKLVRKIRL